MVIKAKCERCEHEADVLYKVTYRYGKDYDLICPKCVDALDFKAEIAREMREGN